MEFRVLGPLEVADEDGTLVRLPAGRARIALALLCANAGQVVSRDRLLDEAWNGAPPATAVTQVQGFISALRRQLGAQRILTKGDGYLLAPCEVDLTRMRALIREARAMREASSLGRAAELLRDALALWRGSPFEGIGCVSLEASADLIDQERASALEEYAEIELVLGGAASSAWLAEQLAGWVGEYPLREGLRGLLIQALLLTGRQAEAIASYHELRQRLADQLGVDPGPALQDLYARILEGDRSLMAGSDAVGQTPVPAQMPAGVPDFTGRVEQVRNLRAVLSADSPTAVVVSALSGTGGVGKSALAVHVAHLMSRSFPGGQLFVNLAGTSAEPVAPGDVLARLLRDLGLPAAEVPVGLDERAARYRSMLAGRRVLLVLDDARDAAQVRPLLPGSPSCAVLVTSRATLSDLVGAVHFGLSVLEPAEGIELFAKIVGTGRAAAEPAAVAEVVRMCAGLPLAIRIAAAKLAARPEWSIEEVAGRLAAEQRRLAELTSGDLAVRASFRLSYDGLAEQVAHAFRLLGLAPIGAIGLPKAAALLGLASSAAMPVLDQLTDAHMLESPTPRVYRLHDLLRLFAVEVAALELADDERTAALARLVRWYAAALGAAGGALAQGRPVPPGSDVSVPEVPGFGTHNAALEWCQQELENLAWAIRTAAAAGDHRIVVRMACLLWLYADRAGKLSRIEASYRVGLESARLLGDYPAEAWLLKALGNVLTKLDRDEEGIGWHRQAMAIYQGLGDQLGVATVHNNMGSACHNLARFREALEHFELAEKIYDSLGLVQQRAMALSNAGTACRSMAEYAQALDRYDRALEIRQRIGDRHGEGASRTALGLAYRLMGRLPESLEQHSRAVAIQRELGTSHWWLLSALDELGQTLAALGRVQEARESWTEAARLAEGAGDPRAAEFRGRLALPAP